jgi:hypothetical protein
MSPRSLSARAAPILVGLVNDRAHAEHVGNQGLPAADDIMTSSSSCNSPKGDWASGDWRLALPWLRRLCSIGRFRNGERNWLARGWRRGCASWVPPGLRFRGTACSRVPLARVLAGCWRIIAPGVFKFRPRTDARIRCENIPAANCGMSGLTTLTGGGRFLLPRSSGTGRFSTGV